MQSEFHDEWKIKELASKRINILIIVRYALQSKMCNARLLYVKHTLNVCYKTYVKHIDRAP